ncbi:lipopolysaccharide biosynthesis protein [Methylocystis heyeri]|uniref:Lipopolysaccharide biosynthesis protein n=1 Tax=Methylocystis heyeri TaxID=391905 RepID=A0A6B8KF59_9HYPH|nr:lipopolysaccharide biosynthesis protein [Methylocystis heyeri]QGM46936.1 lipopolysaccharide biosynthesis protein [Methylocystis heyeri]
MKVLFAFLTNSVANFVIGLMVAKYLGPEEYGRFAIAFSITAVVQTALFDWLRLSATRFYSERVRDNQPVVRASLDVSFIAVTGALGLSTFLFGFFGPALDFESELILLALLAAVVNGLFDYSTALVRARFEDELYGRLVLGKNLLSLILTGGGALLFHSAAVAMGGAILSLLGTVVAARASLTDTGASLVAARFKTARTLAAYSAPIVAAHLIYQAIPLATRSVVASVYDLAETGQFALAFDLGMRAVLALGQALDVLLFQIAVAAHENYGDYRARRQVGRNMAVVLAFLLPACAGVYLVMPSIELLIVPSQYRGPFGHYLNLQLPGLFAMGMILFGVNPVFQIAKKTAPMVGAALFASAGGLLILAILPWGKDASNLALAQCGAYIAALVATLIFAAREKPFWPRLRDILAAIAATLGMAAALQPLREMTPGVFAMLVQVFVGAAVYGLLTMAFDTAGLRSMALDWLRRRREASQA